MLQKIQKAGAESCFFISMILPVAPIVFDSLNYFRESGTEKNKGLLIKDIKNATCGHYDPKLWQMDQALHFYFDVLT